jgi:hypothetical protein
MCSMCSFHFKARLLSKKNGYRINLYRFIDRGFGCMGQKSFRPCSKVGLKQRKRQSDDMPKTRQTTLGQGLGLLLGKQYLPTWTMRLKTC